MTVTTTIAYVLAGLIGVGIIFVGARFLFVPKAAAAAFGIPTTTGDSTAPGSWLFVKGVRDIASGIFILLLIANHEPHLLGWLMIAATFIPFGDAAIVLHSRGPKVAAYAIHGATGAVSLVIGALLLAA
ncbi:DUF4267 domain-containing protein [Kitasatospora sp. McL0602]|uniref:DUF4267 domain-containing protein n=1 Tax=Kitasatospora sp. McL0602 TaxID=3439530 RepID=UPI003F8BBD7F